MMPHDFPEYAALWREQIDPKELAGLQAMATKIKRTAAWRWLLDRVLTLVVVGLFGHAILRWPGSPLIKLGLVLLLLGPIWVLWTRHKITRASRAIAVDDPRLFFEAAIENARAEIRLHIMSFWGGWAGLVALLLLTGAAKGFDHLYLNFWKMITLASPGSTLVVLIAILGMIYLSRDNKRFHEQMRRLEAMRREWEERDPGEEQ